MALNAGRCGYRQKMQHVGIVLGTIFFTHKRKHTNTTTDNDTDATFYWEDGRADHLVLSHYYHTSSTQYSILSEFKQELNME